MKKINSILLATGLLIGALFLIGIYGRNTAVSAQQIQAPTGGIPTLTATEFANGFNNPLAIAHAGDGRLFIAEKRGVIKVLNANGTTEPTSFLDITDRVRLNSEQGLLGLAFDPNYATNGYFYVNYTHCTNNSCKDYGTTPNLYTRVSRFTVTADANVANPASELILLSVQQPYGNHNGGNLVFGPDGYLYIGLGDGGSGGDPDNYGQSMNELLGKMLRIDVDPSGGDAPDCGGGSNYSIPANNPLIGQADTCDEIWASGLRNPWRYSFDRQTNDLYIGDVGQGSFEEVNFQLSSSTGGENYGWACKEATSIFQENEDEVPCNNSAFVATMIDPIAEYGRSDGQSISGGYVYRGSDSPLLNGYYIFADYSSGAFWLSKNNGSSWATTSIGKLTGINNPASFGEDCSSELYVANIYGGEIFKLGATASTSIIAGPPIFDEFVYLPIIISQNSTPSTCN